MAVSQIDTVMGQVLKVRDLINMPRRQHSLLENRSLWFQLCSSLDVIEDTQFAIIAFVNREFETSKGSVYLAVYGLLQALTVQQDAVQNLCESLEMPRAVSPPAIKGIREIRHKSIGHPTKRNRGEGGEALPSFHFISQMTLNPNGFELLSDYKDGKFVSEYVTIATLIQEQRSFVSEMLNGVIQKLEDEDAAHKEKFRMEKLTLVFPHALYYNIGKLFECVQGTKPAEFGMSNLELIKETAHQFLEAVKRRDAAYYESLASDSELLEYAIAQLERFFQATGNAGECQVDPKAAHIFAYFIEKQFDELKDLAQQIDSEYSE